MRVKKEYTTTWADAEEVCMDFGSGFLSSAPTVYMWLLDNIGVQGTGWETHDNQNAMFVRFLFKNKGHATLFRLKWGHLVAAKD